MRLRLLCITYWQHVLLLGNDGHKQWIVSMGIASEQITGVSNHGQLKFKVKFVIEAAAKSYIPGRDIALIFL